MCVSKEGCCGSFLKQMYLWLSLALVDYAVGFDSLINFKKRCPAYTSRMPTYH